MKALTKLWQWLQSRQMVTVDRRPPPDSIELALPLIKHFEGLKLTAYKCPAGVWTIGWGTTGPEIKAGLTWTEAQCEAALRSRLANDRADLRTHSKALTPQQEAALLSFVYNLGLPRLLASTLWRKLMAKDIVGAEAEFSKWVNANGRPLPGLIKRRAAEAKLFRGDGWP